MNVKTYDSFGEKVKGFTFKEVLQRYNEYYSCNEKSFRYKGTEELEEIIIEIFDMNEDQFLDFDYEQELVILEYL